MGFFIKRKPFQNNNTKKTPTNPFLGSSGKFVQYTQQKGLQFDKMTYFATFGFSL